MKLSATLHDDVVINKIKRIALIIVRIPRYSY